jgi:threonine-phosphate decarboxylase
MRRFGAREANFVLIRVRDGASVRTKLLERGIAVRDCASFGLPAYIRVGVRSPADCEQLVRVLQEVRT